MDALVVIWDAKSVDPKKLENELDDWDFGQIEGEKCL